MNNQLQKTALVTGSSSGIGLGIVERFLKAGYRVAVTSYEAEADTETLMGDLAKIKAGEAHYFSADLSKKGAGTELVAAVLAQFGHLDVLVNNAGVQKVSPVEDFPLEDWERVRSILLDASFEAIRAVIPQMKARGFGRVINVASAHGLVASPFKSAYVSAKHGVIGLTKTVALEVAEAGITVNAICPGYVLTPLVEAQLKDQAEVHGISQDQVKREIMLAPQPTKQFVSTEEVAELALYLSGDMARSITGSAISIDGGWTAR